MNRAACEPRSTPVRRTEDSLPLVVLIARILLFSNGQATWQEPTSSYALIGMLAIVPGMEFTALTQDECLAIFVLVQTAMYDKAWNANRRRPSPLT